MNELFWLCYQKEKKKRTGAPPKAAVRGNSALQHKGDLLLVFTDNRSSFLRYIKLFVDSMKW